MEIKVGGTCMFHGNRVKIAAKYHGAADGWILEITNPYSPRWPSSSHSPDVLANCVPPLALDRYYYWVPDVCNYKPPQRKKVYK